MIARSVAVIPPAEVGSATGQIAMRGSPSNVVSGDWLWAVRTKRAVSSCATLTGLAWRWPETARAGLKHNSSSEA
jgi:hypothetical protein